MDTLSMHDAQAAEHGLTGEKVLCSVLAGEPVAAKVTMEVHLPPGVSPERYDAIREEVAAAVKQVAERVT